MAQTSSLYCIGANMSDAFVLSATSEATGFPKENLIDWDPDTYWKPSAVGTNSFVIDLGSAKTIQGWSLWLHNAHVNLNASLTQVIEVYHSTDAVTWTLWDTVDLNNTVGQPIFFGSISTSATSRRYWKFTIYAPALIVEVSMVFLYTKYSITQGNQAPEQNVQGYAVHKVESPSGLVYTNLQRLNKREKLSRTFLFASAGDWEALPLVTAFNDCKGDWRPLILVEDADFSAAKLVRFAQSEIPKTVESFQVYRPTVNFITESFITLGKNL